MPAPRIIITCEHASAFIPPDCRDDLVPYAAQQEPHRLFDWGAPDVAQCLAEQLEAPLYSGDICRLAIDLNRSIGEAEYHAPPLQHGDPDRLSKLVSKFYKPFRKTVYDSIASSIASDKSVLHISIHSFTPIFHGVTREVDLGILFDPDRPEEAALSESWIQALRAERPDLRTHPNQPYEGKADGHTTALRKQFRSHEYSGIEIELNQAFPLRQDAASWASLLRETLQRSF